MKVFRLPSVRVLVAVLASVAASCSEGDAADPVPQRAEGPPEHSVNLQRIRTLDCQGAFVCKQGRLLFITGQGKGHCLDPADDPSSPVVLSDSLPPAWDVAVKGNYAFVVANSRMLSVYDMGDGKTWRRIADCSTPAAAENVIVRDDLAYVAGCRAGLQIISIRDPNSPVLIGESTVAKQDIDAIGLAGDVAYLYDHLHGTLRLVDVTDPAAPKHLSLFEFGRPFIQGEMDVCRGYAYCVAGDDGVVIVDVRDRMAPKLAAVFDTPGYATDVIVSDSYAFVADGEGGIRVADVRDPGKPVEVGYFTSKDLNARQLAVLGNLVYVANEPPLPAVILRFQPAQAKSGRGAASLPETKPQPAAPMKVGPTQIVDYTDPTYGARIRQLRKDDGHEHNLYYYRDPWNADGTRMLGIQSNLDQKHWRVCLYDGDGVFLKELFPIEKYDWRLCWDRNDPGILYTWKGSDLYRFSVGDGTAELLKSFAPLGLMPNGPSCNQDGDRILVTSSDRVFRSYRLPDMSEERSFRIEIPEGCFVSWDKPHYIGYRNYIDTAYRSSDARRSAIVVYDDTGQVVHRFDSIGAGGHYDYSPDGKLAYFKLPTGGRGAPETPLEIHVVNLDGTADRVLFSVPRERAHFHNLHLSWPRKVNDWFVAGFFPSAASAAAHYEPPLDEILMIRVEGTTKYLARTGTVYSRTAGRGGPGDMFWAQTLPRPSADGKRICFNSSRSDTIDLHILYTESHAPNR